MAGTFLNEQISLCARYGSSYSESFDVSHYEDIGKNEYSHIFSPYPQLGYELSFVNGDKEGLAREISDLYKKAMGTFRPFRVKHYAEFTTHNKTQAPTALDQRLIDLLNFKYQLVTWYDTPGSQAPRRLILKPVQDSVLIAIDGIEVFTGYTVNYINGTIQFDADPGGVVTGGCEFDIPMRFAADYSGVFNNLDVISATVSLKEILKL